MALAPFEAVDKNEVLVQLTFYHNERAMKMQEFLVLGSQRLTDLRDRLYCLTDQVLADLQPGPLKSGYFFVENTFYSDMRDPSNVDLSKTVIDWAGENKRYLQSDLAGFTSRKMEETTFNDLSIRLGQNYLYCHQGNCEHILVINNVRLLTEADARNKNAYPFALFQAKIRRRKCRICDIYPAKWVTIGDFRSPENPCYYCQYCYRPLHYTFEGNVLHQDFEVYPYYHE